MEDMVDFRTKLPRRCHSVLFAKAQATGRDMQELAREIVAAWAENELHAATVMHRVLRDEGVLGESPGISRGTVGESGGIHRGTRGSDGHD
jgi:hypothetical protein